MARPITQARRAAQITFVLKGHLKKPQTRTELEALRRKALAGKLTKREIEEFRARRPQAP